MQLPCEVMFAWNCQIDATCRDEDDGITHALRMVQQLKMTTKGPKMYGPFRKA